jgi:hypothetical protein
MTLRPSSVKPAVRTDEVKRVLEFASMKKDLRFTFRIGSDLKKDLESIAAREGRSVAQICDAFLKAGSEAYRKNGPKYLQRFLSRLEKKNPTD